MPPGAAEFAVGREFQSDRGLPVHDLLNLHVLDLAQIVGGNLALLELGTRLLDARRPQQAANLVGAEGGFCSLHGFYSQWCSTSFRDGPKDQTRNLEIPGSMLTHRPGMTRKKHCHVFAATPKYRSSTAGSAFSALLAASWTIAPRSNITTRSASPRIFCAFCSTMMEQIPPARVMVPSARSSSSTMIGASPSVGSSSSNTCGLSVSARPIASICCSPPESWLPKLLRRSFNRGNIS